MQRKNVWTLNGEKEGGMNWELGIDIYSLLQIKSITNENLLYGAGNATQCSVVTCVLS